MKNIGGQGYFGIGIYNSKKIHNIGTLWRSAHVLGASFIFTIQRRYELQSSDVFQSWQNIPLYNYDSIEDLKKHLPYSCPLVGVEICKQSVPLQTFKHPQRAIYLLGAEDDGLSRAAIDQCHHVVQLPGDYSLNVATTGSIVMYDRVAKLK